MGQLASLFDDDKPKAALNLRFGIEAKPDDAAREAALAKRFGLPAGVIAEYRPDYEARAKVEDAQPLLDAAPKLRGWLAADSTRAEIAHDDVGPLSAIESAVRVVGGIAKAAVPGMASKAYGAAAATFGVADQAIQALDDLAASITGTQKRQIVGTPGPESFFLNESKAARQKAQASMPDMSGWSPEARGLVSGLSSGLENLLVMPLGFAQGGEAAMLGAMGALTGGGSYAKAREAGVNPAQSFAYGAQDAAAEVITEKYLGAAGLLRNIKAGASAGKLFMYELAKEVPGEITATVWQNFNEWLNLNPDKSVADFVGEQPDAIRETIVATLVGGGVQIGAVKGVQRAMQMGDAQIIKADDAQKRAEALTEATTLIEAGKLRNRSPESFAEFADELVANDVPNLYIDAQTLNQSGVNMDEVLQAMPSVAAQIERAVITGGDLVIPTAEFLTIAPGKEFAAALIDNARTAPDAMSPAEAKQYMAERGDSLNAEIAKVLDERQADDAFQAQRTEVKDYFVGQLNATKRFTPDVNEAYASLLSNFYSATASRAGMAPNELLQRYGLRVSAESVAGARTMEQATPAIRSAIGAAIKAKAAFDAVDRASVVVDDADAYFALSQKATEARDKLAEELAAQPDDGFVLQGRGYAGRMILLNRSAQNAGQWQLTRFDGKDEPLGDSQYSTKAKALEDFLREIDLESLQDMSGALNQSAKPTAAEIELRKRKAILETLMECL